MSFLRPAFLWTLVLLLPYSWFCRSLLDRLGRLGGHLACQPGWHAYLRRRRLGLAGGAVFILAVSFGLAEPSLRQQYRSTVVRDTEVAFLLDISNSMLSTDGQTSRLEVARAIITELVDAIEGSRFSLTVFKGQAMLLVPPTSSRTAFLEALAWASPELMSSPGSNLEAGLRALASDTVPGVSRAIVVLSDGNDSSSQTSQAVRSAAAGSELLLFLGFGSDVARPVFTPDGRPVLDRTGQGVSLAQDRRHLQELASVAKARYIDADGQPNLGSSLAPQLQAALGRPGELRTQVEATSAAHWCVGFSLLAFALSVWWQRPYPAARPGRHS